MAEHRALAIVRAIRNLLIDQTLAGANVEIGRSTEMTEPHAISIHPGADSAADEYGISATGVIDSVLRVYVDLHTRTIEHQEQVLVDLFQMREETHRRLMADPSLGKAYVISIRYAGADDVSHNAAGDRIGTLRTLWDVGYRMVYSDPRE